MKMTHDSSFLMDAFPIPIFRNKKNHNQSVIASARPQYNVKR